MQRDSTSDELHDVVMIGDVGYAGGMELQDYQKQQTVATSPP
jgi:hypothetical protein